MAIALGTYKSSYYIKPSQVTLMANDQNNPSLVYVGVRSGTYVEIYYTDQTGATPEQVIGYGPNSSYQKWQLSGSSTKLASNAKHYIYIRLRRTEKTAMLIFSTRLYDFYGENPDGVNHAVNRNLYYYILVGELTATDGTSQRELTFQTGNLSTPENSYNKEEADSKFMSFEIADQRYLNQVEDDTAKGIITFLQGIKIGSWEGENTAHSFQLRYDETLDSVVLSRTDGKPAHFLATGALATRALGNVEEEGTGGGMDHVYNVDDFSKALDSFNKVSETDTFNAYAIRSLYEMVKNIENSSTDTSYVDGKIEDVNKKIDTNTSYLSDWIERTEKTLQGNIDAVESALLENIDTVAGSLSTLQTTVNDFLTGTDTDTIINRWKELEAFLNGYTETATLADLLSGKADKATTLAGYGITNAYTKTEVDSKITSVNTSVTTLQTTVSGHTTSINSLQNTVSGHTTSINSITSKITTLQGYFTNGVANFASRLSDSAEYKAWGQTFFKDGKPVNVSGAGTFTHITAESLTIGNTVFTVDGNTVYVTHKDDTEDSVTPINLLVTGALATRGLGDTEEGGAGGADLSSVPCDILPSASSTYSIGSSSLAWKDGWFEGLHVGELYVGGKSIMDLLAGSDEFTALEKRVGINETSINNLSLRVTSNESSIADINSTLGLLGALAYKDSLAFSELTNKPTTLLGYGITDGVLAGAIELTNSDYNSLYDWADNNPSFVGSIHNKDTAWYNVISLRHRNGTSDGNKYGMLLYSQMTASGAYLYYIQQKGGVWDEKPRAILDSSNFSSYAVPLSGGTMTGKLGFSGGTYPHIYGNGTYLILAGSNENTKAVIVEKYGFRPYTNNSMPLGISGNRWSNVYSVKGDFASSEAGIIKIKRTTTTGGAFIDYYHANQDTNYWRVGVTVHGHFLFSRDSLDTTQLLINTKDQLVSRVADGTAPFIVASKTEVANLNAMYHGGLAMLSIGFPYKSKKTITDTTNAIWYAKVTFKTGWNNRLHKIYIEAKYNNINGNVLLDVDGYSHSHGNYIVKSSKYNGNNVIGFHWGLTSDYINVLYLKLRGGSSATTTVYSTLEINTIEVVDAESVPTLISLSSNGGEIWTNYNINANASTATYATSAGNADTLDGLHADSFDKVYTSSFRVTESGWYRLVNVPTHSGNLAWKDKYIVVNTAHTAGSSCSSSFKILYSTQYGWSISYNNEFIVIPLTRTNAKSVGNVRLLSATGTNARYIDVYIALPSGTTEISVTIRSNISSTYLASTATLSFDDVSSFTVIERNADSPSGKAIGGLIAEKATVLSTPVTLWGQSFDGSGNVDGTLHITKINNEADSYNEGIRINSIRGNSSIWLNTANRQGYNAGMWGITAMAGGNLRFRGGATSASDLMNITKSGNVLIGTTTDNGYKLDVNGTFHASGNATVGGTLDVTGLSTFRNDILYNSGDATLKIYDVDVDSDNFGNEAVVMQTCFDTRDPETSDYVTRYEYRCNLLLQPRGGQVYVGYTPTSAQSIYALSVGQAIRLYGDANSTNAPEISFYRDGKSSWKIINNSGNLCFQNNYTTAVQSSYFNVLVLSTNTGDASLKGSLTTGGNILPNSSGAGNVGTSSAKWLNGYINNLYTETVRANTIYLGSTAKLTYDSTLNALLLTKDDGTVVHFLASGAVATRGLGEIDESGGGSGTGVDLLNVPSDIIPSVGITYSLGSSANAWKMIYANGGAIGKTYIDSDRVVFGTYIQGQYWSINPDGSASFSSLTINGANAATQNWVNSQLSSYATTSALSSYATNEALSSESAARRGSTLSGAQLPNGQGYSVTWQTSQAGAQTVNIPTFGSLGYESIDDYYNKNGLESFLVDGKLMDSLLIYIEDAISAGGNVDLSNYVTLNTEQTITERKTFSKGIIGGLHSIEAPNSVFIGLDSTVHVYGGLTIGTGDLKAPSIQSDNVLPKSNGSGNIGSSSLKWLNGYFNNLYSDVIYADTLTSRTSPYLNVTAASLDLISCELYGYDSDGNANWNIATNGIASFNSVEINSNDYIHTINGNADGELVIWPSEYLVIENDTITDYAITCSELVQTSDIRYKNILSNVHLKLSDIAAAPTFKFSWANETDGSTHIGTSAQYWQEIAGELVVANKKTGKLGLDYSTAALVSAVSIAREVNTMKMWQTTTTDRIGELEERVKSLEEENKALRELLNNK